MKAPDILGAWSCYRCHVLCDTGRYVDVQMMREERERLFFKGMARTINQLVKEGKLLCE